MDQIVDRASDAQLVELTAEVVAAYVGRNAVPAGELPGLIAAVHEAFGRTASGAVGDTVAPAEKPKPAVPVRKSVTDDHIVCLEDGKAFKSLKRHLMTHYNLTPDEYRARWDLPADYPMVAPNYAAARSRLAKQMGLGNRRNAGRRGEGA